MTNVFVVVIREKNEINEKSKHEARSRITDRVDVLCYFLLPSLSGSMECIHRVNASSIVIASDQRERGNLTGWVVAAKCRRDFLIPIISGGRRI